MSVLVVGSVALDDVETPSGSREEILGGAATIFACAASFFTRVRLVGVVGRDFPREHLDFLGARGVDLQGLQRRRDGLTFRWRGRYSEDLSRRETLDTQLNVFEDFSPRLPPVFCDSELVFLANIHPALQLEVLGQVRSPRLIACDTMNYWIEGNRRELDEVLGKVSVLIINDDEAKLLSGEANLVRAGRAVQGLGPTTVVIKRGESGAWLLVDDRLFVIPAFPLERVVDPTGAGDAFAGGFMGYLDLLGGRGDPATLRQAVAFGAVMGSFVVEDFSLDRLRELKWEEVLARWRELREMTVFEDLPSLPTGGRHCG